MYTRFKIFFSVAMVLFLSWLDSSARRVPPERVRGCIAAFRHSCPLPETRAGCARGSSAVGPRLQAYRPEGSLCLGDPSRTPSGVKYLCLRRSAKARTKMKFHENTLRGFTQTYMGASSLNTLLGIWTRFAMASFSASPVRPPSALSMVERDLKTGVRILPPISRGSMTW